MSELPLVVIAQKVICLKLFSKQMKTTVTYTSEPFVAVRWPRSYHSVHRCIPPTSSPVHFQQLSRVFPFQCTPSNNHIINKQRF